jgi:hypothetical protein
VYIDELCIVERRPHGVKQTTALSMGVVKSDALILLASRALQPDPHSVTVSLSELKMSM